MIEEILKDAISEWRKTEKPLYIWGNMHIAEMIGKLLNSLNIKYDGYVVNNIYYTTDRQMINNKPVYPLESILEHTCCNLIVGFTGYKSNCLKSNYERNINKLYLYDFLGMTCLGEDNTFNESFLSQHKSKLDFLFHHLCDETSKEALKLFIDQKTNGTYSKPFHNNQYFLSEIVPLADDEVFIDCGGFDGDSTLHFIEEMKKRNKSWKCAYCIEGDLENVNIAKRNLSEQEHVVIVPKIVSKKTGKIGFTSGNGQSSKILDTGILLDAISIDDFFKEVDVTFIKMDIEGAELDALVGAQETIRTKKPKLAICVYHKIDDLITIPQYILSLNPAYKLYLRNHHSSGTETVLYAI